MIDLETSFRSLIRVCEVTKASDDTKAFPVTQVQYMGKVSDAYEVYPYGMCAVAPAGSLGVLLNIMGQEENKACIATLVEKRFNGLKEGEVAFGNFLTGSFSKFNEDGSVTTTVGDTIVNIGEEVSVTSAGGVNITANGDIKINAKTNKVAFGNDTDELLDLIDQTLTELIGATVVDPISGPLPFSPAVVASLTLIQTSLAGIKGTL